MQSGEQVGNVQVSKRLSGEMVHYETRSDITLQLLLKFHITYQVKAAYKDGILQASHATVYLNGEVRSRVDMLYRGAHYDLVVDGKLRRIERDIACSSSTLYFEKPGNGALTFSETSGNLNGIRYLSDGRLQLSNPQKVSEDYLYSYANNTLLKEVSVDHALLPTLRIVHLP